METLQKRPTALVILDGWGLNERCEGNAFCQAHTPVLDALMQDYPTTRIGAAGPDVGLPEGQMGNSEVGHLNIGAGRIIYQEFTRISKSIEDGSFFNNEVLIQALENTKKHKGKLHLMGLLSDGGVHSHKTHLYALIELGKRHGIEDICIHAFLDGRDTPPQSGAEFLSELEERTDAIGAGRVATVVGRYYAMDRDNRWDRVERAYRAMTLGEGASAKSSAEAIEAAYAEGQTDEFVEPRPIFGDEGTPGTVEDGDGIIFFNFRSDRAREITRAFTQPAFKGFERPKRIALSAYVCMTQYDETFDLPIAFPSESYRNILGEILANAGKIQLRIAETEKYAHITFFFNGGDEVAFTGEERVLIPSPQEVATYDQKPEMSAFEVTDEVVRRLSEGKYDFIVLNFANPDMVGHTGVLEAAIRAMEAVDKCIERVVRAVREAGGRLIITSDHGNCEKMADAEGKPHTAHTSDPVPLILVDDEKRTTRLREGILADIAPTILELMGVAVPPEMTGTCLLES